MLSTVREYLSEFPYRAEEIIGQLRGLRKLKVLVIGDAIIDQYIYCSSIGKSPKDNIMVVKYLGEENFAGGVLAAVNHVAGFCDDVTLVTCLGQQETYERFISQHLKKNVNAKFFYREDSVTPIKRRFVEPVKLTKIFGVSIFDDHELPEDVSEEACDYLGDIQDYDLILITDFGHGFINNGIVRRLEVGKFLAVNTQTNTDNAGFNLITKYPSMDYICLDEPETRLACCDKYGDLEELIRQFDCDCIAVTHGQYDTLMYSQGNIHRIPALAGEVRDTTGAGDAFLSISSLCVASGLPADLAGFVGNAAGALKVQIVCNRSSVEPEALYRFIKELPWTTD